MCFRLSSRAVLITLFCAAGWAQPAEPRRLALLIANSDYQKIAKLAAPARDVRILKPALENTRFRVTVLENVTVNALRTGLSAFLQGVNPGDQVLMFYSGHAVQSSGDNVLLPVEFDPDSQAALPNAGVSLTRINEDLDDRKPGLRILLLDASREDKRLAALGAISGEGLTVNDVLTNHGTAVICSAPLNQTVPEPPAGSAGALATAFAKLIQQQGSSVEEVIRGVLEQVRLASGPPFTVNQLNQKFYFVDPPPPPPPPTLKPLTQISRRGRLEYRLLPGGSFLMGCVPSDRKQDQCEEAEKPQHKVTITKDFWIGVTDVTNDAYARFVSENKGSRKMPEKPYWEKHGEYPDHPVVNVNWETAQAFCAWSGGRLPTEAQWEYAARGGKVNEVYPLNAENSRDKANFLGVQGNDIYPETSPVKKFDPNPWGLYDMAGNVWQWTADWYSADYYKNSPPEDPHGPESGSAKVARGGSFRSDPAKHLRISYREKAPWYAKAPDFVGFRCVLEDTPATHALFAAPAQ